MALDNWNLDIAGDPLDIKAAISAMVASSDPVVKIPSRVFDRVGAEIDALVPLPANTGFHVQTYRTMSPGTVTEGYVVKLVQLFV